MIRVSKKLCSLAMIATILSSANVVAYATEGQKIEPSSSIVMRVPTQKYCSSCTEEVIYAKDPTSGQYVHIKTNTYDEVYDYVAGDVRIITEKTYKYTSYVGNYRYEYYSVTRYPA